MNRKQLKIVVTPTAESLPPLNVAVIAIRRDNRMFSAARFEFPKNVYNRGLLGPGNRSLVIGVLEDIVDRVDFRKAREIPSAIENAEASDV